MVFNNVYFCMKFLELQNSTKVVLVDDNDFTIVSQYKWYLAPVGYARATINKERYWLHRFLLNPEMGKVCDHINNDKLDNQRSNLRVCTTSQNIINSFPRKNKQFTEFKGVRFVRTEKRRKKWAAQIEHNNKSITIGRFYTEIEAAIAYNKKAKELFGDFAKLNVIKEKENNE